jgi:hypothetical protein
MGERESGKIEGGDEGEGRENTEGKTPKGRQAGKTGRGKTLGQRCRDKGRTLTEATRGG